MTLLRLSLAFYLLAYIPRDHPLGPHRSLIGQNLCLSLLSQLVFHPLLLNICVAWRLLSLFKEFIIYDFVLHSTRD